MQQQITNLLTFPLLNGSNQVCNHLENSFLKGATSMVIVTPNLPYSFCKVNMTTEHSVTDRTRPAGCVQQAGGGHNLPKNESGGLGRYLY